MSTYFLQVGNTPELSVFELERLTQLSLEKVSAHLYFLQTEAELDIQHLQQISGGLVKAYRALTSFSENNLPELEKNIIDYLASTGNKVRFSINNFSNIESPQFDHAYIKKALAKREVKSRYLASPATGLSAAVLNHQNVTELVIIQHQEKLTLAKTVSIQNIDDWSKRDRQKPYANRKKGMLPPKVARMMVNIAQSFIDKDQPQIYDPFCGSGTILMEGLLTDCKVIGSDLDSKAVEGTKENIAWLIDEYQLPTQKFKISQLDVVQPLPSNFPSIDAIVTEPFLGKPKPREAELKNIFTGLYRTYLGAFKNWSKTLSKGGVIVLVLPLVETQKKTYNLDKLIDKISQLGYTMLSQPIVYSRPQAIVKRQLHFIRLKGYYGTR